ncbi:MAG: hypothetical protein WCE80_00980, partial [Acidimicrobiia bacterium]
LEVVALEEMSAEMGHSPPLSASRALTFSPDLSVLPVGLLRACTPADFASSHATSPRMPDI